MLRVAPYASATASSELAPGEIVRIERSHDGFTLVRTAAGQVGLDGRRRRSRASPTCRGSPDPRPPAPHDRSIRAGTHRASFCRRGCADTGITKRAQHFVGLPPAGCPRRGQLHAGRLGNRRETICHGNQAPPHSRSDRRPVELHACWRQARPQPVGDQPADRRPRAAARRPPAAPYRLRSAADRGRRAAGQSRAADPGTRRRRTSSGLGVRLLVGRRAARRCGWCRVPSHPARRPGRAARVVPAPRAARAQRPHRPHAGASASRARSTPAS